MLVALYAWYLVISVDCGTVTQANFDRIQKGMTLDEVTAILGDWTFGFRNPGTTTIVWPEGENWISVDFADRNTDDLRKAIVCDKSLHLVISWGNLQWHVKKGLEMIGVR